MPTSRGYFAAAAANNKIYALGGYDGTNTVNTNAEYDPATNAWSSKSSSGFTARSSFAAAAINNRIYALGGLNSSSNPMNSNEEYDPTTNTWATKASLPTARGSNAAAVVNGNIYVFGGGSPFGLLSTNEEYSQTGTFYLHIKQ
jgi:N-acetylneuraminic acid mutarotase